MSHPLHNPSPLHVHMQVDAWNDETAAARSIMQAIQARESLFGVYRFSNFVEQIGQPVSERVGALTWGYEGCERKTRDCVKVDHNVTVLPYRQGSTAWPGG